MKMKIEKQLTSSDDCFVCGQENKHGMRTKYYLLEDGSLMGLVTVSSKHQGYPGIVHGGASAGLLDETVGRAIIGCEPDTIGATIELNTKFLKAVPCGVPLIILGRVVERGPKAYISEGEIILPTGERAVTCRGTFLRMTEERINRMGTRIEAKESFLPTCDLDEIEIPDAPEPRVKVSLASIEVKV